jgi:hypothetical protein
MQINKVFLNGVEISMDRAKELAKKYLNSEMMLASFRAGLAITTPEGIFQAEVSFII